MTDRLTQIKARVACNEYHACREFADLEYALGEIERLKVHYKGIPHDWVALQLHEGVLAERDRLRKVATEMLEYIEQDASESPTGDWRAALEGSKS